MRIDHFDLLAPFYKRFIQPKTPERLLSLLALQAGQRVLDRGGGTGRVAQYFIKHSGQVIVANLSLPMLRQASRKGSLEMVNSSSEQLPFLANAFERILLVDSLHHVSDQRLTLLEAWRLLAPGGRLVIEEPDIRQWMVKLLATAEKLALMRSHFLLLDQMRALCAFPRAMRQAYCESGIVWLMAIKSPSIT